MDAVMDMRVVVAKEFVDGGVSGTEWRWHGELLREAMFSYKVRGFAVK